MQNPGRQSDQQCVHVNDRHEDSFCGVNLHGPEPCHWCLRSMAVVGAASRQNQLSHPRPSARTPEDHKFVLMRTTHLNTVEKPRKTQCVPSRMPAESINLLFVRPETRKQCAAYCHKNPSQSPSCVTCRQNGKNENQDREDSQESEVTPSPDHLIVRARQTLPELQDFHLVELARQTLGKLQLLHHPER